MLVTLVAAGGASCPWTRQQLVQPAPVAFSGQPSLADVVAAVNQNTAQVQRLQSDDATLNIDGIPALRANLALERPSRFRMRASITGVGQMLDLGSNDELFWAMIDTPEMLTGIPKAVYFARHDQFQHMQLQSRTAAGGDLLPIQPSWLPEAMGLVELDPHGLHEGPYARGPGQLEIRSRIPSPAGELTRVLVLDDKYGWVLEQHLHDSRGQTLASAVASAHRYYPAADASLPHAIEIRTPPPGRSFGIEIGEYTVNQLSSDPQQLFTMPAFEGFPLVDLGRDPRGEFAPGPPSSPATHSDPGLPLHPAVLQPPPGEAANPSRNPLRAGHPPLYRRPAALR